MFQTRGALGRLCRHTLAQQNTNAIKRLFASGNNFSFDFLDDDELDWEESNQRGRQNRPQGGGFGGTDRGSGRGRSGGRDGDFRGGSSRDVNMSGGRERSFDDFPNFSSKGGDMRMQDQGQGQGGFDASSFRDVDWDKEQLETVVKDFYRDRELPEVRNRDPARVAECRKEMHMTVTGDNIPNPIENFAETTLDAEYLNVIEKMGITTPSPIQQQGVPMALSGRDMVGVSKTGSGKTLAFILPAIVHINAQPPMRNGDGPICLVLAPTRELAVQIEQQVKLFSEDSETRVQSAVVYGGASRGPQMDRLGRRPQIVIATPGRLLDFLSCHATNLKRCTYLVLDEADRMLDMGFQKDLETIMKQCRPERQTLMFSATWPKEIRDIARKFTKDAIRVQIGSTELSANNNITQTFVHVGSDPRTKDRSFFNDIKVYFNDQKKILVFVNQKRMADSIAYHLNKYNVPCSSIHGDKSQGARDQEMNNFKRGRTRVLVATDVCARGIDIRDISVVINYDMPTNVESYVHRIGRTARGEDLGESIGYVTNEDMDRITKDLIPVLERANQEVPQFLRDHWGSHSSGGSRGGFGGRMGGGRGGGNRRY